MAPRVAVIDMTTERGGPTARDRAQHGALLHAEPRMLLDEVITLRVTRPYELDWPTVKDLTTPTKIYFRPETGGVVLVGTGDQYWGTGHVRYPDGSVWHIVQLIELKHGKIARLTSYFAAPFEAAEWRKPWVTQIPPQPGRGVARAGHRPGLRCRLGTRTENPSR